MVNQVPAELGKALPREKTLDVARRILALAYEDAAAHDPDPSVTALLAIGHGLIALTEEVARVADVIRNRGPS